MLSSINAYTNFRELLYICSKDIERKPNSDKSRAIIAGNIPKLDLVNINAYIKFGEILSICSQDIEQKRNSDVNQGPYSVTNLRKMTGNNPNLDLVNINALYIKSDINQRP